MKRRIKAHPTNQFYSSEPAVATGKMADKSPVQSAFLGNQPPRMVDKHPGRMSGVVGFVSKGKPTGKSTVKTPAFGTKAKSPASMKVSGGHPKAPKIGLKKLRGLL